MEAMNRQLDGDEEEDEDEDEDEVFWFDGKKINEVLCCQDFLSTNPVRCINGHFFTVDGMQPDSEIERQIYEFVKPFLVNGVEKKVRQIAAALKLEAHSEEMPVQLDRLHVANGTLFVDGTFREEKEFCLNRLPVAYHPQAAEPVRWLQFVSELLEQEDIPTLQEYMGYCLLPTNKAQRMMSIIGKGGEGKSRIGLVMRSFYEFTVSDKTRNNLQTVIEEGNNVIAFMGSEGYVRLEKGTMATSKALYQAYCKWCEDNMEKSMTPRSFSSYLSQNEDKYGIRHSTNIPSATGKKARGFTGIHVQIRTEPF